MKKFKKFLVLLAGVLTVVCLSVMLAGCSSDVDGNTYTFDHLSVTAEGLNEEQIASVEAEGAEYFSGMELSFADGKVTIKSGSMEVEYEYTQDGDTVTILDENGQPDDTLTVDGDEVIMEMEMGGGMSAQVVFKK